VQHGDICIRIRLAIIGALVCLVLIYGYFWRADAEPFYGMETWQAALMMLTAIPCLAAAVYGWKISNLVQADRSFSADTARCLKNMSNCAFADAVYFLALYLLMCIIHSNYQKFAFQVLIVVMFGLIAGIGLAALARFVQKAADLQEDNDLTI